jgi:plastocyanin
MLALMALFGARGALVSAHGDPHPAHIHEGTCDELDPNPAFPLNDVSDEFLADDEPTVGDEVGGDPTLEVEGSTTTVEVSLDDLVGEDYAINVHKSAEEADVYIACGNIGGYMVGDDLVIGLGEQNDSGYSGVAILAPDGDSTVVTVYVTTTAAEEDEEEEATAEDGEAAGTAIDIADFAFSPAELTVSVGDTVTWTNQDSAPHTVTSDDGAFDSGRMDQGDTFEFTFEEAGTFTYHCDFHPNMVATITVE